MIDIVMPQMGESIVEGTLTKWLKKQGEHVERDEPLFEISTDKVDTEIPSPAAGVLSEVLVAEGKTVAISTVVGKIDEAGGNGAAAKPAVAAAPAKPAEAPAPAPPPAVSAAPEPQAATAEIESPNGPLSPLVRKMAREYNIDLKQVKGTGAGGRITKQDLESYMSAQGARTMAQATPPAPVPATPAASAPVPGAPAPVTQPKSAAPASPPPAAHRARVEPMSTMRQSIAKHMLLSKQTSAHVTTVHRVDMTKVAKMRDKYKADFKQRNGLSLTFLPFVARAAVEAIRTYPILNASI